MEGGKPRISPEAVKEEGMTENEKFWLDHLQRLTSSLSSLQEINPKKRYRSLKRLIKLANLELARERGEIPVDWESVVKQLKGLTSVSAP